MKEKSSPSSDFTMKLLHPSITPESPHFRLAQWPPPDDWPAVIGPKNEIISRVGDARYDFTSFSVLGERIVINFTQGSDSEGKLTFDDVNAGLYRRVVNWWMWADRRRLTAKSLHGYAHRIKPLFVLCCREKIAASEIHRFPHIVDKLVGRVHPSTANEFLTMVREFWSVRDQIGFVLLDERGMERFEAGLPDHKTRQTPYIPPRIWIYQNNRLRQFLEDFLIHQAKIEAVFNLALDTYLKNFGSAEVLFARRNTPEGVSNLRSPFIPLTKGSGLIYLGSFMEVTERYGIADLLNRWHHLEGKPNNNYGIKRLSRFMGMAMFVGHKYLLNMSGMRSIEARSLRTNSFEEENDPEFGQIFLLVGETTKTVQDSDARWVTSKTAKLAIDVMACVAKLRASAKALNPFAQASPSEKDYLLLTGASTEPWTHIKELGFPNLAYDLWESRYPALFDRAELTIQEADLRIARLVTPTLDPDRFAVGRVWPLSNHQLRRTLAVNMSASDEVSDVTLQYQLKHLRRAMALYYGQGFSRLRLNMKYTSEYLRTAYEMLRLQLNELFDSRYASPFGDTHKINLLKRISPEQRQPMNPRDSDRLEQLSKNGGASFRRTLVGLCLKDAPCEYGGIQNIIFCSSCDKALGDKNRLPQIKQLRRNIEIQLKEVQPDSPESESLQLQLRSAEVFIRVLQKA